MENAGDAGSKASWTFFARIMPERQPISFPFLDMEIVSHNLDVSFHLSCHIHNSQIIANINDVKNDADIFTIKNLLKSKLNSYIDLIGFLSGMHYDIDIISAISDVGEWRIFGTEIPVLYNRKYNPIKIIDAGVVKSVIEDPVAELMLSDYREAMRSPLLTGFFCYHAIEACMQSFKKSPDAADAPAWEAMREALKIDLDVIFYIKKRADWARHAKLGFITDEDRVKIFTYMDEILDRYFEYVIKGRENCLRPNLSLS